MSIRLTTILAIGLGGLLLTACNESSEQDAAQSAQQVPTQSSAIESRSLPADITEAFYLFLEEAFEEELMDSPESLTQLGRRERYGEWDDYSDERILLDLERDSRQLEEMRARFDINDLPPAAQTSYRIFEETRGQRIARAAFFQNTYPVTHRQTPASWANVFLANRHFVANLDEAEAYIARINGIEATLDDVSDAIMARAEFGVQPPAFMYPSIIEETRGLAAMATPETVESHPIMLDFTAKVAALDIEDNEKTRLLDEARTAIVGSLARGYDSFIAVMEDAQTYTTTDDGIWRHPRGAEDYASRIRARLGADIDPEEIHNFGLAEVARIQGEMEAIAAEVGFEGTLQEFFVYLNEAEQFKYPNTDEGRARHMADMNAALTRMMEVAPQQFNLLPQAEVEIRRVEPFREQNAGRAFYNRPTPDGSTPGIFYANQRDMNLWRTWHVDTLVFHEAVPGHHFQIALAQELEDTPTFQTLSFISAYGEGWALYSERLAYELGLFSDPYANFGRLNGELLRAMRLVVDTGLHHYRWSRQEAVDYMAANSPLPLGVIESEVQRYLVWPTQALGYKMGMTEILRQRTRARDALGDEFDIRSFHDAVIGSGPVPLPVLGELVDRYIASAGGIVPVLDTPTAKTPAIETPTTETEEQQGQTDDQSDRLNVFFAETFEAELQRSPTTMTQLGRKDRYGEWDDLSDAATIEEARIAQVELDRLHSEFDYDALDGDAQISYRIFEFRNENRIASTNFYRQAYPVHQMFSFPSQSQVVLTRYHDVESVADAEAYISRLEGYEAVMAQLAVKIRDRTEFGVLPPAFTYPLVMETLEQNLTGAPFDDGEPSALWADFNEKVAALEISAKDRARLLARAESAMVGPMRRGFENVIAALREAIPLATHDDGVWQVPNGDAYYAQRVNYYTQTDMTPDEIHEWGLRDVERLHNEMRVIMAEVGFEGTLQEFFEYLNTDPDNYYPDDDEGRAQFLADAEDMTEQVMAATPTFFNLLPEAPIEVRRVEPFREALGTIAHYSRPSADGSRPGIFYANLRTMSLWPKHTMEAITYHEGIPGHHFQIALAQELEGIPAFRTFGFTNTAYVEGWGLYSELVAYEMGFYQDPYSNFGRLATDLWRAVRLVVDTGLHNKRWTRDEAFSYMMENTPLGEGTVRAEINRYIVWPGQALAYRVGRQRILDLREEAQEALGDEFDIRTFHDAVLGSGAVPLPILEEIVRNYIEEELAN